VGIATVDLSADGHDELLALTSESVVVISRRRGLFAVRSQVALPAKVATQRSRDPIGAIVSQAGQGDGDEVRVRVRTSEHSAGTVYAWRDGGLVYDSEFLGYPMCDASTVQAKPGQNFFLGATATWTETDAATPELSPELYSAQCSQQQVNPRGAPIRYFSEVSRSGVLRVQCLGDSELCESVPTSYAAVGYANLVVDLDHDGFTEVVTTSAEAVGAGDKIQVFTQKTAEPTLVFERSFDGGIVALSSGDFDGDGALEVVAAERQAGSGKVRLWLLN